MLATPKVEYGATQPGTTNRLPIVGKHDKRVVIKRSGLPTLLYCPSLRELVRHLPATFLLVGSRMATLGTKYVHSVITKIYVHKYREAKKEYSIGKIKMTNEIMKINQSFNQS